MKLIETKGVLSLEETLKNITVTLEMSLTELVILTNLYGNSHMGSRTDMIKGMGTYPLLKNIKANELLSRLAVDYNEKNIDMYETLKGIIQSTEPTGGF